MTQPFETWSLARDAVMEAIEDLVFVLDTQDRIVEFNVAAGTACGLAPGSIGKTADMLPQPWAELFKCHREAQSRKAEAVVEIGGKRHIYDLTISPVLDAHRQPVGRLFLLHDVTERGQLEELIRVRLNILEIAATQSLETLMPRALDEIERLTGSAISFYHFVEPDQKTLSLQSWSTRTSKEFCTAKGKGMHYSIEDAGVWVDCVHEKKPVIHNDYASLPHRRGLPPGHAEVVRELVVPIMRSDRVVSVLGVGNKPCDYDDTDVALVSYIADIVWAAVERKRAEKRLEEYQCQLEARHHELNKLMKAVEQSASTIVITNTDGVIEYANPRFEETTGYSVQEALGQNPRILKSGHQDASYYSAMWDTIRSGRVWRGEFHNRRKDGTLYWEEASIAPVHSASGQITHFIAVKEDITERRRAQELQRQQSSQLAAQNAELDAFSHTVAHDLKNPVSVILGFAELLGQRIETDSPAAELLPHVECIQRVARKLDEIIEELMMLSGVRNVEVTPEPVDCASLAHAAVERLGHLIDAKHAEVTLADESQWPRALGHAPWIEQIWINYISNAVKYGGLPPKVEVGAQSQTNGQVLFWVRDNGIGLDNKAMGQLFAPFTRLHQSGQTGGEGHGLGLSIVHRIAEKLGGSVGVESEPGIGSVFFFTLPSA